MDGIESRKISEGTYGCIYTPPLPCKGSTEKEAADRIGKIESSNNARIDVGISVLLEQIPGYSRYYITQKLDTCDEENIKRLRKTHEKNCKIFTRIKDDRLIKQVLSKYGGQTIGEMKMTPSFDYLGNFRHVLEGIAKMNAI
jgi:hypothetical protein